MIIGLDVGTNLTKATNDGSNVVVFPSLVVYGEEKDWSLKGETKKVYIGEEAMIVSQTMENVEVLRPLHEGRIMHQSYIEIARYAVEKLGGKAEVIATGLPVKSSKKEREEVSNSLRKALNCDVILLPQPVGSLIHMGKKTGVCVDIGFGTTDVVVLFDMEYLKGDTMLVGIDDIYGSLELFIRNEFGISITPEEMAKLLLEEKEVGRIRGGKRIVVRKEDVMQSYEEIVRGWVDRVASRVKMLLEGLSTSIVENLVLTGGGSLLPMVYDEFQREFEEIANVVRPDDPITANAKGFYKLAKMLKGEKIESKEEKTSSEKKEESSEEKKGKKK
ncbi:rod shape-determining protein [Archaeoglobus profundus]|uniref:Actin-like protein ATPase involved in cell morphogenesis-like protein n=1 Tax=Archaeoglobus profundus (strain DSM 5631 / JCM 9629 / NBRC 100127 / Av18) TaxID=572546 RepID=D2REY3_ARCPA|nr:rod shape-determining protein [Archaeoglobus profundus]ADB58677.1 Actin-like protein ATPase involved in cell morphogenesis- like protein [Archaeoglobus profundus DSM 5631]